MSSPQIIFLVVSLLWLWVGLAHTMEDLRYEVGKTFNLSLTTIGVIFAAVFIIQISGILLVVGGQRLGYVITLAMSMYVAIASIVRHLREILRVWPYREGALSKTLIVGEILTSIAVMIVSLWALVTIAPQHSA